MYDMEEGDLVSGLVVYGNKLELCRQEGIHRRVIGMGMKWYEIQRNRLTFGRKLCHRHKQWLMSAIWCHLDLDLSLPRFTGVDTGCFLWYLWQNVLFICSYRRRQRNKLRITTHCMHYPEKIAGIPFENRAVACYRCTRKWRNSCVWDQNFKTSVKIVSDKIIRIAFHAFDQAVNQWQNSTASWDPSMFSLAKNVASCSRSGIAWTWALTNVLQRFVPASPKKVKMSLSTHNWKLAETRDAKTLFIYNTPTRTAVL